MSLRPTAVPRPLAVVFATLANARRRQPRLRATRGAGRELGRWERGGRLSGLSQAAMPMRPEFLHSGASPERRADARCMLSSCRVLISSLAAALVVCGSATSPALGKGSARTATPLSLTSEYIWNSPNPSAPTWCLNEDDWHVRTWSGALDGTFATTERLCDGSLDLLGGILWNAGGIGLQADLVVAGRLDDLSISSPQGDRHHAVLVGSTTSKGTTLNHYQVCYAPAFALASNSGGQPLPGGTWQVGLAGSVTQVSFTLRVRMTDVPFQQAYCPASEQNLV
jgi:hypothetical protein